MIPCGSSPFTGSSNTKKSGFPANAIVIPNLCRILFPLWILFTIYSILHPQYGQNSSPFNGAIRKALWQKGQRFLIAIIIRSTISNATPVSAHILQSAIHEIKIKKPNMMPTILQIVLNNLNELMILFPPTASYFNKLIS